MQNSNEVENMQEIKLQARNDNELLAYLLARAGIDFERPCGGIFHCGKCKIKVSGPFDEISEEEGALLSQEDIASGVRLACFAHALGEVTIYLPEK